ncbi:acyltransferase family protein [Longispora albida]|uniref:acyltransferase family protein n=1 Tax=Longispora albida TaxID=203523 RepID=UPI000369C7CE|nr:acyltransferase [Longispora albida]
MATDTRAERNRYVDFLRGFSLVVVVVWHWAFTIIRWRADGPHATSPLRFTTGMWILTWLFQVMPLFFYIGGFVHLRSWERARERGTGLAVFVWRRIKQLAIPSLALLLTWVALGLALEGAYGLTWIKQAVKLVVSPLWFIGVYLMLVTLLPVALWLHRRFGSLTLVWLAGLAMMMDILRFNYGQSWAGWANLVIVWGLAHQAGFFYQRVVAAPRRSDWVLLWIGLFGLMGLVFSGLYPGSMVGVPGDKWSNMAPPTFVIVALLLFQMGVVEVARPRMESLLTRSRWQAFTEMMSRFALPLFLFHTTGMAISRFIGWLVFDQKIDDRVPPDVVWWLYRPLAIIGPLICTLPVIWLFGRRWVRKPVPVTEAAG